MAEAACPVSCCVYMLQHLDYTHSPIFIWSIIKVSCLSASKGFQDYSYYFYNSKNMK